MSLSELDRALSKPLEEYQKEITFMFGNDEESKELLTRGDACHVANLVHNTLDAFKEKIIKHLANHN